MANLASKAVSASVLEFQQQTEQQLQQLNSSDGNLSSLSENMSGSAFQAKDDYLFDRVDVQAVMISLYTIVFCSCFFGNLLVILVVTLHWRMRSITNFCLANLAFADLCVGVFCVYQNLSTYLIASWVFGDFMCKMYHFINSLSHTASILILVVICVERYLAIIHPMQCKQMLTLSRLRLTIVAVWVASAIYCSPRLYYINTVTITRYDGEIEIMCIPKRTMYDSVTFDLINMLLLFFLPLLVITVLYTQIGIALWRSSQNSMPTSSTSETSSSSYREIEYHNNSICSQGQGQGHPNNMSSPNLLNNASASSRLLRKSNFFQRTSAIVRHPSMCHWTGGSGNSGSWTFRKKDHKRRRRQHHRSSFSTDTHATEISYHYNCNGNGLRPCNGNGNGSGNGNGNGNGIASHNFAHINGNVNGNYKHCNCQCQIHSTRCVCGILVVNNGDAYSSNGNCSPCPLHNTHNHGHNLNHVQSNALLGVKNENHPKLCNGNGIGNGALVPLQTGVIKSAEPIVVVKFEKTSSFTKKSYKRHRCTILMNSSSNFTRVEFHNGTSSAGGGLVEGAPLSCSHCPSLVKPGGFNGDTETNSTLSCSCSCESPPPCSLAADKNFECNCTCNKSQSPIQIQNQSLNLNPNLNSNGGSEHGHGQSMAGPGKLKRMRVIRSSKYGTRAFQSRRRIIRMLIVIVFTFAICNLPFHARKMWQNWSPNYEGGSNFSSIFTPVTFLIMYANSGINPLLYAFMSNKFRLSFRDLLCCKMRPSLRVSRKASTCLPQVIPHRIAKNTPVEGILTVQTDV